MKNNISKNINIALWTITIFTGFVYFYYCGKAVFEVMSSSISVLFLVLQVLYPKKSTIDPNNNMKETQSVEKRPIKSTIPKKKRNIKNKCLMPK